MQKIYQKRKGCTRCVIEFARRDMNAQCKGDKEEDFKERLLFQLESYIVYKIHLNLTYMTSCYQYCRTMRDQILESFGHRDFSLMVVGNKYDLVDVHPHSQVSVCGDSAVRTLNLL